MKQVGTRTKVFNLDLITNDWYSVAQITHLLLVKKTFLVNFKYIYLIKSVKS